MVLCTSFLRYSFESLSSSVRPILKCVSFGSPCAMAGKKFPVSAVRWISYVPYWLTMIEAVLGVSREMVDHWVRGVGEVLGRRQVDGLFGRIVFQTCNFTSRLVCACSGDVCVEIIENLVELRHPQMAK